MALPVRAMMLAMALTAMAGNAGAAETIVGYWQPTDGSCSPSGGGIYIGPKEIVGDEFSCQFKDVSRRGDVVTWAGRCGFPEPMQRSTVVASLRGRLLTVAVNGGQNGPYRRCQGE